MQVRSDRFMVKGELAYGMVRRCTIRRRSLRFRICCQTQSPQRTVTFPTHASKAGETFDRSFLSCSYQLTLMISFRLPAETANCL
jgi:hypothetical protein